MNTVRSSVNNPPKKFEPENGDLFQDPDTGNVYIFHTQLKGPLYSLVNLQTGSSWNSHATTAEEALHRSGAPWIPLPKGSTVTLTVK